MSIMISHSSRTAVQSSMLMAQKPAHLYSIEELQERFRISRAKAKRYLAALTHAAWMRGQRD